MSWRVRLTGGACVRGAIAAAILLSILVCETASRTRAEAQLPGSTPPVARIVHTLKHPHAVFSVAWSPDGTQVATGGLLDMTVSIWDPATGRLIRTHTDRPGSVMALAYSPEGRFLVAGRGFVARTKDHMSVDIWEAKTAALVRSLRGPVHATTGSMDVGAMAFSPDGSQLVAAYLGAVLVYDVKTGGTIRTLPFPPRMTARPLASSPDGRAIAGGDVQGSIRIWDGRTGNLVRTIAAHSGWIESLAYAPDGKALASGSLAGSSQGRLNEATGQFVTTKIDDPIRVWNADTGNLLRELAGHTRAVQALVYSRDARRLFSGSADRTIRVWDATTGALLDTLKGHGDRIYGLALGPDGRSLASVGGSTVTIWRLEIPRS